MAESSPDQNPPAPTMDRLAWLRRRSDLLWGALLFVVSYVTLRISSPSVGFTRDEGYYFKAGEQYIGWYRQLWSDLWSGQLLNAFSDATITRFFEYNHEHPALIKTLMGLTWWWTHEVLGITSNAEGFRVVGPLFAGLTVAFTFALGRRAGLCRSGALFAGLAWLLMPHNYFYSHLACFDVPVTAMTVLVVYTYLTGRRSWRGALLAGLVFGLACATKHNALFLFFLLGGHFVLTRWRQFGVSAGPGGGLRLPPIPFAFLLMPVGAALIMFLHWPYLWHHPLERFGTYLAFHLNHEHYPISYFGQLLVKPPFPVSFPFVMTSVTMPLLTLALALVGMALGLRALRRAAAHGAPHPADGPSTVDGDSPASVYLLWGIMALFPILLIAGPSVPIFGGNKHWMPSTPFLALFAGLALERVAAQVAQWRPTFAARWVPAALVVVALVPSLLGTVSTHPYGMSYYNELAGGVRGGADKNLQRTFWGHSSYRLITDALNRAPDGARVFMNRTNYDSFRMYQRDGLLKRSVRYASKVENSDLSLVFHQGGYYEELYKTWAHYETRKPVAGVYLRGVPLVTLYARAGKEPVDRRP